MKKIVLSIIAFIIVTGALFYLVTYKSPQHKSIVDLKEKSLIKKNEEKRLRDLPTSNKKTLNEEEDIQIETDGNETAENINVALGIDCEILDAEILNFFSHLDQRDYIKEHQLGQDTYSYFKEIIDKLSNNRPIAGAEQTATDFLRNAYHFYRTISKSNIILIKDIIEKESDSIEKTMDSFYQQENHCKNSTIFLPPFDILYDYAYYFLSTIGGKAYLFRLDSKIRILLLYYSTMIVHEANNREINKYGIDLRSHLQRLEDELNNYTKLSYSDNYIAELNKIKKIYSPSPAEKS